MNCPVAYFGCYVVNRMIRPAATHEASLRIMVGQLLATLPNSIRLRLTVGLAKSKPQSFACAPDSVSTVIWKLEVPRGIVRPVGSVFFMTKARTKRISLSLSSSLSVSSLSFSSLSFSSLSLSMEPNKLYCCRSEANCYKNE